VVSGLGNTDLRTKSSLYTRIVDMENLKVQLSINALSVQRDKRNHNSVYYLFKIVFA